MNRFSSLRRQAASLEAGSRKYLSDAAPVLGARLVDTARETQEWLRRQAINWLSSTAGQEQVRSPINFDRLLTEVRMGDVLLVEGRTRLSRAIRAVTQSNWTHSALVVGSLDRLRDPALQATARAYLKPDELEAPLIVESELGRGTVLSSVLRYRGQHLRLCRPHGLSYADARRVTTYAMLHLGADYNVRQVLDLARFLVPWWTIVPRRWHSSLFEHNHQDSTRLICSTMIARAFHRVHFPVVPLVVDSGGKLSVLQRNPRLVTPRDFDHSPYFSVIKYPLLGGADLGFYRKLPWAEHGLAEEAQAMLDDCNVLHVKLDEPDSGPDAESASAETERA